MTNPADEPIPPPAPFAYLYVGVGDDIQRIRAYSVSYIDYYIDYSEFGPYFDPHLIAQFMRANYPLPSAYTWCVYGSDIVVIVNNDDLRVHETRHGLPPTDHIPSRPYIELAIAVDGVLSLEEEDTQLDDFIDVFEDFVRGCSGLTEKKISENLRVTSYSKKDEDEEEEEEEMCVVCLVEFERNEKIGVLECKHQYHTKCITTWLLQHNVCPLCKAQGLRLE